MADGAMSYAILGILFMLDICFLTNYYVNLALRRFTDVMSANDPPMQEKPIVGGGGGIAGFLEKFLFGCILGKVKPMPLSIQRFPEWKPISHRLGVVFTSILVLISLALMSPQYFQGFIKADLGSVTLSGDFCKGSDVDAGLLKLEELVDNLTNYKQATLQHAHMMLFHEALVNDTTLYGTTGYECPGENGKKSAWTDLTKKPASTNGPFFPGYCAAAQQFAIDASKNLKCDNEKCACPRVPSTGATRFFNVDGKQLCFLRLCLSMPTVCPGQTNDAEVNLKNYREQQLALAADEKSFDDIKDDVSEKVEDALSTVLTTILFQVDIASNFYSVYSCLALFFPTPLEVFRYPHLIAIKRFLFGAHQTWFMLLFVAAWWGIEYFRTLWISEDFQTFLKNLQAGDPCFLDGEYLAARQGVINDICANFVSQLPEFETSSPAVNTILFEVDSFANEPLCNCKFPMDSMYDLRTTSTSGNYAEAYLKPLGFDKLRRNFCAIRSGGCLVYTPNEDIVYLGNRSLCLDSDYQQELALQAPNKEADWSEIANLWISSGLVASFLVKIAMTNFAIELLKLADPFVTCGGEFMWIPAKLGSGFGSRDKTDGFRGFKTNKEATLKNLAIRGVIIWGAIMHGCLFNLLFSAYDQNGGGTSVTINSSDAIILPLTLGISVAVVSGALVFMRRLRNKARLEEWANKTSTY